MQRCHSLSYNGCMFASSIRFPHRPFAIVFCVALSGCGAPIAALFEADAGVTDASTSIGDASHSTDAATPDAGETPDAGDATDAGEELDAGAQYDAGEESDAGVVTDAGSTDAGPTDCEADHGGCDLNANCIQLPGAVTCTCKDGYVGDGYSCVPVPPDADECAETPFPCDIHANCTNTTSGYQCECWPGFHGDGHTCVDIGTCAYYAVTCPRTSTCVDMPNGTYQCICKPGYKSTPEGDCENVNECDWAPSICPVHSTCTDLNGSYRCDCESGYVASGQSCVPEP